MSKKFETSLFDYFETICNGESVLIEYTPDEPIHLIFYLLLRYAKQNNIPTIIVDTLDQLHIFKTHLELIGIDTEIIDNVQVIKLGGIINVGNVIGKIDLLQDIPIWKKQYDKIIGEIQADFTLRIIIGLEKALKINEKDSLQLETFFGVAIRPDIGNKKEIAFMFLNTSLLKEETVQELREISTRVFDIKLSEGAIVFKVVKSIVFTEYEKTITVKAQALRNYLAKL